MANIKVELTKQSKLHDLDLENIVFGREFSDHMFVMDYYDGQWRDARIEPFQNISVSPAFLSLHYAQSIFEGLKAFYTQSDEIVLFRPQANFARLNKSAERMCIPAFDEAFALEALKQLVNIDKAWVPKVKGASLYIRPLIFATDEFVGVKPSESYRFIIFTSPVNKYYDAPVKVKIEEQFTRACSGGVGFSKTAGNYAASLYPTKLAQKEGFDQLIWTDGKEHKYIEESGTMNLMVKIGDTLITPKAGDTILAGITRDSVLKIARDWGMKVEERNLAVQEILDAHANGTLLEVFGTGTAVTICHIVAIGYRGKMLELPPVPEREFSNKVNEHLAKIRSGSEKDKFDWIVKVA
ncbi:MAG: branched-chain amino acid aminotransferase [Flavobacteriales bacterium]